MHNVQFQIVKNSSNSSTVMLQLLSTDSMGTTVLRIISIVLQHLSLIDYTSDSVSEQTTINDVMYQFSINKQQEW